MFVRTKKVKIRKATYEYLQVVNNSRFGNKVKQKVVATLGRLDALRDNGDIDGILRSISRFSDELTVTQKLQEGSVKSNWVKSWGACIVFEKLWKNVGLDRVIRELAAQSNFQFDLERAVFASVLNRLVNPRSDLATHSWLRQVYAEGFDRLDLQHLYRSMDFLADYQPEIEKALFDRGRNLFDYGVDLVFFDTTSTYFEGRGPDGMAAFGHTKDHRPDRVQIIVGVVMSRRGYPISCQFFEGNTADVRTIRRVIDIVKRRFELKRVILVADRGMVSVNNLMDLETAGVDYIVGIPMRRYSDVKNELVVTPGYYQALSPTFWFKEVFLNDCRYVLCYNDDQAKKDHADREAIVETLKSSLKNGGIKALVGNKGYRKYLEVDAGAARINIAKLKDEERFDGKYVLLTSLSKSEFSAEDVAVSYKRLWQVERAHRDLKSVLEMRPVFHQRCDRVQGHIFCNFLSLYLKIALQKELEKSRIKVPWRMVLDDLEALKAIHFDWNAKEYLLRTEFTGCAYDVFKAVGAKPPKTLQGWTN